MNDRSDPVAIKDRIEVIDILRGFALFGIFTINIASFTPGGPPGFVSSSIPLNDALTQLLLLLVESKFFTLFSFLFGLGFAIQMIRAEQRGERITPRFSRRLLALALMGILHIYLLWEGDILLLYAMIGFILLAFRKVQNTALIRWVIALLTSMTILVTIGWIIVTALRTIPHYADLLAHGDASFINSFNEEASKGAKEAGSSHFWQEGFERIQGYIQLFPLLVSRIPTVLAMFLLGLYVGKKGILQQVDRYRPLFRKAVLWGLGLGISINMVTLILFNKLPIITGIFFLFYNQTLAGPLITIGMASGLVLLSRNPRWSRALAVLAYPGRMALTNYLLQSVVFSIIFYSYGLGLKGEVQTWQGLLIAIFVYVLQIIMSRLWLSWFRFGPIEWVWRCITYLKVQPFRRGNGDL